MISPNQMPSLIKLAWALFNIGGAALLFLTTQNLKPLKNGVLYGAGIIALFICAEYAALIFLGRPLGSYF